MDVSKCNLMSDSKLPWVQSALTEGLAAYSDSARFGET